MVKYDHRPVSSVGVKGLREYQVSQYTESRVGCLTLTFTVHSEDPNSQSFTGTEKT